MTSMQPRGGESHRLDRVDVQHTTARQRARAQTEKDLLAIARRHLGEVGGAGLSLRAIAREQGLVSSAVYRYFSSRDELLTRLIIEAFDDLGECVELAESRVSRLDIRERFAEVARAARLWATAHPHQYALIYGSPVPGYSAPQDTVGPATRVAMVLFQILQDAWRAGISSDVTAQQRSSAFTVAGLAANFSLDLPGSLLLLGVESWSRVNGAISFELFGHFHRVVDDGELLLEFIIDEEMRRLGL